MHRRVRTVLITAAGLALAGAGVVASPATAATGGGCQLDGTANFHPGPGSDPNATWSYDFAGALSNCQSSDPNPPTSGNISAGQTYSQGGFTYQEPVPTGSGSCAAGQTAGTAILTWADKTTTVISYTTTSAGAAVNLQGNVVPSVTLQPTPGQIDPATGLPPAPITVATSRYAGDQASGALAFEVSDPSQCTAPTGVQTAGISGATALGNPNG